MLTDLTIKVGQIRPVVRVIQCTALWRDMILEMVLIDEEVTRKEALHEHVRPQTLKGRDARNQVARVIVPETLKVRDRAEQLAEKRRDLCRALVMIEKADLGEYPAAEAAPANTLRFECLSWG